MVCVSMPIQKKHQNKQEESSRPVQVLVETPRGCRHKYKLVKKPVG
jgi:hypothetical protein